MALHVVHNEMPNFTTRYTHFVQGE